jgi:glutathione synthase
MKPWLIVLDPVNKLEPILDTSFFITEEAIKRRVPVYFTTEFDLSIEKSKVHAKASKVLHAEVPQIPRLAAPEKKKLEDFSVIWIRKDPPFDAQYVRLCWLLGTASSKCTILNTPDQLLRYHEKLLPMEGLAQGFLKPGDVTTTFLNASAEAKESIGAKGSAILKPLLGHGGRGVEKVQDGNWASAKVTPDTLIQPYLTDVETLGDYRVLIIAGKVAGYFTRLPKSGHYLSNIAQGGTPKFVELKSSQKKVLERVCKFLKKLDIFFAGVDLIGNKVSEINITSPSGVRLYFNLTGVNVCGAMVEKAIKRSKRH